MTESTKNSGPKTGVSRRAFLKASGAAAAAAGTLQSQQALAEQRGTRVVQGSTTITLYVNGKTHKLKVEPRTTLLDVLRYQLDLTGAKPVSLDGDSGASTVWIDDKPVTASTTLAIACQGKQIKTIEGFGEKVDTISGAFVEHDAQQCGFCTPGFVMALRSFLNKNPRATEAEIRAGLNGNICRCGTYANIIQAAVAVVKGGGNG